MQSKSIHLLFFFILITYLSYAPKLRAPCKCLYIFYLYIYRAFSIAILYNIAFEVNQVDFLLCQTIAHIKWIKYTYILTQRFFFQLMQFGIYIMFEVTSLSIKDEDIVCV